MVAEATVGERQRRSESVCVCERLFVYRVKVISGASVAAGVNEEGRGR